MSTQWRPFDQNLPYETTYTLWNTLQLPQSLEHCLNCQLWALSRMSFKLEYPINTKKSVFLQTITFQFVQEQKWPFLTSSSGCFTQIIVANPNSTSTVKSSLCCSLKVTFFVLIRFPGWAAAVFCYSSSWPCLDFQNHDCIACCIYSHSDLPCKVRTCCDSQWSFFQIQEQQAKFANEVYLLTRFFEKVDS